MDYNEDGNLLGRAVAVALIALAAFGVHRITCGGEMCPLMKTSSCCAGDAMPKTEAAKAAAPVETPKPARKPKPAPKADETPAAEHPLPEPAAQ